jgi:hypothetical protein
MRKLFEFKRKCSLAIFSGHTHTCDLTEILECVTKWSSWRLVRVQLLFNTYAIRCHQTTHHVMHRVVGNIHITPGRTIYGYCILIISLNKCHKNLHVQIELQRINIHENRLRIYLLGVKKILSFVARNLWPRIRQTRLCAWHPAYC